jgi:hypothetical protein
MDLKALISLRNREHIPKFRNGTGKILANASTPDFSGAPELFLGYAFIIIPISKLPIPKC